MDELEERGKGRRTWISLSFFGAILVFGYGSVMLEVFAAVFLLVAIVLGVGDARRCLRMKRLRTSTERIDLEAIGPAEPEGWDLEMPGRPGISGRFNHQFGSSLVDVVHGGLM